MAASDDGSRVDSRQLALVGVALLGLVLAGLLAPPPPEPQPKQSPEPGGDELELPDLGDGDGEIRKPTFVEDGEGEVRIDGKPIQAQCVLGLSRRPVPGGELDVLIKKPSGPVEGATVYFNGDAIGRTNELGITTGTVPYEKPLEIRVEFPGEGCDFSREVSRDQSGLVSLQTDSDGVTVQPESNVTIEFRETDHPDAAMAYPGERVTAVVSIADIPMADAEVEVAGKSVGTTDESGSVTFTVPNDGSEKVSVSASRGDFSGERTLRVATLEVSVAPQGILLLPGADATVTAKVGGISETGAPVTLDGRDLGRTDGAGKLDLTLPTRLDGTISVESERQTQSVSLQSLYLFTGALIVGYLMLTGLLSGLVARRRGRGTGAMVFAGGTALLVTAVGVTYFGPVGSLAGLVPLGVLLLVRYRRQVRSGFAESQSVLAAAGELLRRTAVWLARQIEATVDWLVSAIGSVTAWLRSRPVSPGAVVSGLLTRLKRLPTTTAALLGRLPLWTIGAVLGGVAVVAVAFELYDWWGAVIAALALLSVAFIYVRPDLSTERDTATEPADPEPARTRADQADTGAESLSLREIWRAFARRVRPSRWRISSPGEVARDAVEKGYPDSSVRELTNAFRELEYSDRQVGPDSQRRAKQAYERLVDEGEEEER